MGSQRALDSVKTTGWTRARLESCSKLQDAWAKVGTARAFKFEPLPAAWLSLQHWCMLMWNTPATETMLVNRKSNSTVPTWSYTLCVWHLIRPRSSLSSLHLHIFRIITISIFRRNRGIFFTSLSTSSKARYGTRAKWRCCGEAPFTSPLNDV